MIHAGSPDNLSLIGFLILGAIILLFVFTRSDERKRDRGAQSARIIDKAEKARRREDRVLRRAGIPVRREKHYEWRGKGTLYVLVCVGSQREKRAVGKTKIGFTKRVDVRDRIVELAGSRIHGRLQFRIFKLWSVSDCSAAEALAHVALESEFWFGEMFDCSPQYASDVVERAMRESRISFQEIRPSFQQFDVSELFRRIDRSGRDVDDLYIMEMMKNPYYEGNVKHSDERIPIDHSTRERILLGHGFARKRELAGSVKVGRPD